ncbi:MAG: S8 family serine peptidase [Thermoleophilia bacterium]|nr:S8 family serine peptidase [Thermoleophilia bacterium]
MRGRFLFVVLALLALVLPAASVSTAEAGNSSATLSKPLANWLSTAGASETFNTIVTFYNRDGMGKLDSMGVAATDLSQLPISFAKLTPAQVRELASSSAVRSLWHDQKMELYLDESVALTKADKIQAGSGLKKPYTGAGVSVAVIDTGVDGLHPDLPAGAKMEGYANAGDPDIFDSGETAADLLVPAPTGDTYGHGTHVASTVAGLGLGATGEDGDGDGDADRFVGMAPGAKIFSFKTDFGAFLWGGWILASFDWILQHNADVAAGAKQGPKILVSTNSWGCCDGTDYRPDDPVNVATKTLYDTGVTVLFAASNSGGPDTLNQYATSPWVISVAAGTKDLKLASFSSRGRWNDGTTTVDTNWDRRKAQRNNTGIYRPTITAPGEDIEAAKSTHAAVMADGTDPFNPLYTYASGTSMATPHVAGAVALMLEARPALQPQHVIDILEGTADDMPAYETFEVGMGHLDALEAVQAAEKGRVRFPPSTNGKTPAYSLTSSSAFAGTAQTGTWLFRPVFSESDTEAQRCAKLAAAKQDPRLSFHDFSVASGTEVAYTEIEWADQNQLIYLVLYAPDCTIAGESAALLDIGSVRHRSLLVTNPQAGTWTVGVYGRINLPTQYTGGFRTYKQN